MRRRQLLSLSLAAAGVALLPGLAFAQAQEKRLILVLLNGALDGLALCAPTMDPDYRRRRGHLALDGPEHPQGVLELDGFFGLHPAMAPIHPWFATGELGLVHAIALPYTGRSHFDALDLLENGTERPQGSRTGWLNRALLASGGSALAVGDQLPLVLRGEAPVDSVDLSREMHSDAAFLSAMQTLYQRDALLGPAYTQGLALRMELAEDGQTMARTTRKDLGLNPGLARQLGRLMAPADGPQVAVVQMGGWDTHNNQQRRLDANLGRLADGLAALKKGLGPRWEDTLVLAVTEFGRTVRGNGTAGSDHGTGSAALYAGGAAAGGVVLGDWPGLAQLHEDRDLRPTTDLRALFKAALEHLGAPTDERVFPGAAGLRSLGSVLA
ncbi:MAG: DUF1501 domain-containing protein [Myxococcota bacterium]|nr:DUF1501 domain-containing protein [Myxococcota bacterium]